MKKYFFIISILIVFLPSNIWAETSCDFPLTIKEELPSVSTIKREFFKYHGYLIFIHHYEITDPIHKDRFAKLHFKNIVHLAEKEWGKNDFDVNDYWDENGRAIPYVLIELGGSIEGNLFYSLNKCAKIGTCYDRQIINEKNIHCFDYKNYQQIIQLINKAFIPALVVEDELEKRK